MAQRFNRLHFFQRFDPSQEFVAIKVMTFAGVDYTPGESFVKDDVSTHRLKTLWQSRKIAYATAMQNPANVAAVVEASEPETDELSEGTVIQSPEIVEGKAGWLYVEVDGKRIGSATRDRDEAEAIALEWIEANG